MISKGLITDLYKENPKDYVEYLEVMKILEPLVTFYKRESRKLMGSPEEEKKFKLLDKAIDNCLFRFPKYLKLFNHMVNLF